MDIPEHIKRIKIDVGLGQFNINSVNWLDNEYNLFVCMFDASPKSVDCIKEVMMKYGPSIEHRKNSYFIHTVALGNVETPTTAGFYQMNNDSGTSSLYQPTAHRLGPVQSKITVDLISLKHFFDTFPWNRFEYIEYLKVDVQGADLDVLKGAGNYLKDRVVYVTAEPEFEEYTGCSHNTAQNITDYMLSQNFIKYDHPKTKDPTFLNLKFIHLRDSIYIHQQ
jgi:FkbM family methyltransferase